MNETKKTEYPNDLFNLDPSKFYFWLGEDSEVYYHADGKDTKFCDEQLELELFPAVA